MKEKNYTFIGSYFDSPREITRLLDPQKFPIRSNYMGTTGKGTANFQPISDPLIILIQLKSI